MDVDLIKDHLRSGKEIITKMWKLWEAMKKAFLPITRVLDQGS